jgi:antimicrobial peptide system SdpA family protein
MNITITKKDSFIFILVCLSWLLLVSYIAIANFPHSPISFSRNISTGTVLFIPEGWGFFSKSPRDDIFEIYVRKNNNWQMIRTLPFGSARNYFGLKRDARATGVEFALLSHLTKEEDWRKVNDKKECFQYSTPVDTLINIQNMPLICGDVMFVTYPQIPWAWYANQKNRIGVPAKFSIVKVICKN